jgi:hypothetical protein
LHWPPYSIEHTEKKHQEQWKKKCENTQKAKGNDQLENSTQKAKGNDQLENSSLFTKIPKTNQASCKFHRLFFCIASLRHPPMLYILFGNANKELYKLAIQQGNS